MSLYKQLISLITIFLVFMLTIILWFILNYNKDLIENQLSSNARNSASLLGLSISTNVDFEDISTIEGMITSIVDNGFYEYIAVYNNDEKEIIRLSSPREIENAHEWFSKIISINAPSSTANIMKGWLNVGTLEVKIHQDYANNQLWKTFKSISKIFIFSTILLLIIFYFLLNKLLRPLEKLSIQAKAIDNNEFIIEKNLPNTIEFRNVVQAMNKTISKMETIFNKEVEALNKYNDLLYKHEDTGLGNRHYLLLKLNSYLKNSHGLLVFIDIKDEISFKKEVGFINYSAFKKSIVDDIHSKFSSNNDMFLSLLNDGVLAILLPNTYFEDIEEDLNDIYLNTQHYIKEYKFDKLFDIHLAIGISNYVLNCTIKNILSKTDKSLSLAMNKDKLRVNYLEEDIKYTKQEWIKLLQWAFDNDGLLFETQGIVDIDDNKTFMQEYYTRLKDKDGTIYASGEFWSTVSSMGWTKKLEKKTIGKIFKSKQSDTKMNNTVINLSTEFVCDKVLLTWLFKELETKFSKSNTTFYFECINAEILPNLKAYELFAKKISQTKHHFAIESFTFDENNLDYLKILKPSYLKISKSYLMGESKFTDSLLLNISSTIGAYLIVKHVETKEEYNQLKSIGIKYLQGKYLDAFEVN